MKIVVVIITIIIMTKEQEREGGEDHFHWSEVDHRYARRKSWTNSPFSHSKNFRCNVTHQKSSSLQDKALGHSSTEPLSYESPLLPTWIWRACPSRIQQPTNGDVYSVYKFYLLLKRGLGPVLIPAVQGAMFHHVVTSLHLPSKVCQMSQEKPRNHSPWRAASRSTRGLWRDVYSPGEVTQF